EEPHGIHAGPVLEVKAAAGEHLLHRGYDFVDERIQLSRRDARLPQTKIERIVDERLIGGPAINVHRQEIPRRHGGAPGVELELADGNAHAVRTKVTETENPTTGSETDHPDVLLRPVLEHLLHPPLVLEREIESSRPPEDMSEFQARLRHRRVIEYRQESRRIGHHDLVEERLIGFEQPDQIDGPLQIRRLGAQLLHDPLDLRLLWFDARPPGPSEAERLAFPFRKMRGVV